MGCELLRPMIRQRGRLSACQPVTQTTVLNPTHSPDGATKSDDTAIGKLLWHLVTLLIVDVGLMSEKVVRIFRL